MEINLGRYSETKPHFLRLVLWRAVEKMLYVFPSVLRIMLLRLFGAKIGKRCLICRGTKFYAPWNFQCGDFVCIGPRVEVYCKDKVTIGSQVVVSQDAYLCTASHDVMSPVMKLLTKPIIVGSNAWIAARATVLPGVTVGEGGVIGACAVVAKDVSPWMIVVGNPAIAIRNRLFKDGGEQCTLRVVMPHLT